KKRREADEAPPCSDEPPGPVGVPEPRQSLYQQIADLAGERDYDTYWERHFEHNAEQGSYHAAALELGRALRELEEDEPRWRAENLVREAYMRRRVEQAIASGHKPDRIAAVVGAFHAPTLTDLRDAAVTLLGQGELATVKESLAQVDVGTAIGQLPKGVSQTSIQADFDRELERLKLDKYRSTVQQALDLDLRENRRVK